MRALVRLLYITVDAPFFVTHHLSLAKAARNEGYDVHIAAPLRHGSLRGDEKAAQQIEAEGLPFHDIPLRRSSTGPVTELSLFAALHALVNRVGPNLVHCIGMKPNLYGGFLARLKGLPCVLAVIGLGSPFLGSGRRADMRRALILRAFAFASGHRSCFVTVENTDDRDTFLRVKAIDPERTFLVRGVGADLSLFYPRSARERREEDPPIIMLASRLIAAKGIREFVAAARRVKSAGVPARFVLVGERDPENPTCIAQAELKGWQEEQVVEWWGYSADMPRTLHQADVFCLPTYYREGLPKVLIEAAATGLPLIATDIAGCRDIVRHGENGLLVPPRDVDRLTDALRRLINDPALRQSLGRRSRALAEEKFSLEAFLAASLAIYRKALDTAGINVR
jgi:glycosyltransferase involved in cell wall biosynthesis